MDYEANIPYSFTQQEGVWPCGLWTNEIGAFISDQIQVRPNLQASLGLRYDWQTYFEILSRFCSAILGGLFPWSP